MCVPRLTQQLVPPDKLRPLRLSHLACSEGQVLTRDDCEGVCGHQTTDVSERNISDRMLVVDALAPRQLRALSPTLQGQACTHLGVLASHPRR